MSTPPDQLPASERAPSDEPPTSERVAAGDTPGPTPTANDEPPRPPAARVPRVNGQRRSAPSGSPIAARTTTGPNKVTTGMRDIESLC
jgi:hypothetical protein